MASIDKTYTNSYKEYKEFKNWANTQIVRFFDGYEQCIGNWVWNYKESDFDGKELPIMNTPVWVDIYLIQNCKIKFVIDRMREVYNEEAFNYFKTIDLSGFPPKDYIQNRKITIKRDNFTNYPLYKTSYGGRKWWIQCEDSDFHYNEETKTWGNTYYPYNTNTAHLKTLKAIIRHLRKQYLPKGISFRITGKYRGEEYIAYIH